MAKLLVDKLIKAFASDSDGGTAVTKIEAKNASLYPVEGDLDPFHVGRLLMVINTPEADGSLISEEEIDKLVKEDFFDPDFFAALAIENARQNTGVKLFSNDLLDKLRAGDVTATEATKETPKWFDTYLKFQSLGLDVSMLQVRMAFSDGLNDEGYFIFMTETFIPLYLPDIDGPFVRSTGTDIYMTLPASSFFGGPPINSRASFLDGTLELYRNFKDELETPDFAGFVQFVRRNYNGIEPLEDLAWLWETFKSRPDRERMITNASYVREFSAKIPLAGRPDEETIVLIKTIMTSGIDLNELAATFKKLQANFNLPSRISAKELSMLLDALENNKEVLLSDKFLAYTKLLSIDKKWEDILLFADFSKILPDDVKLFASVKTLLDAHDLKFSAEYKAKTWIEGITKESVTTACQVIAGSENIKAILTAFNVQFPKESDEIDIKELLSLATLDKHPEAAGWVKYTPNLIDSIKHTGGKIYLFFPANELACMAKSREIAAATIEIIEKYPNLFEYSGFGCAAILDAPKTLAQLKNSPYYKNLVERLHITNIRTDNFLNGDKPAMTDIYVDSFSNEEFVAAVEKIIEAFEAVISEEDRKELRNFEFIDSLRFAYKDFPKLMEKIPNLSNQALKFYSQFMNGNAIGKMYPQFAQSLKKTYVYSPQPYPVSDLAGVLLLLINAGIEEVFPKVVQIYNIKLNAWSLAGIADSAALNAENLKALNDPQMVKWYKKLTSENRLERTPNEAGFEPVTMENFELFVKAFPAMFKNRKAFYKVMSLYSKNEPLKWNTFSAIFSNPTLLATLNDEGFYAAWFRIDHLGRNDFESELLQTLKVIADAGNDPKDTNIIEQAQKLGCKINRPELAISLRGKEATLADPAFADFLEELTSGRNVYLSELPMAIELYEALKNNNDDTKIFKTETFVELDTKIRQEFNCGKSFFVALASYQFVKQGLSFKDIDRVLRLLSKRATTSDLAIILAVTQNQEWEKLLKDRSLLEEKVATLLEKAPPVFRQYDDFSGLIEHEEEMKWKGYNERPDLTKIDSLFLLRTYIMLAALEDKDFVEQAAKIVAADILDKRTEYGGVVVFDPDTKKIEFRVARSLSFEDGSFATGEFVQGALFMFHAHALKPDTRQFAGPSGVVDDFRIEGGDLDVTRDSNLPGMVITACGLDASGHLMMDFDIYQVVKDLSADNRYEIYEKYKLDIIGSGLRKSNEAYFGLDDEEEPVVPTDNGGGNGSNLISKN